jgi:hypothetical protein
VVSSRQVSFDYTSVGGFVVGKDNTIEGVASTVSGGWSNTASDRFSSVSGGRSNTVTVFAGHAP